MSGWTLIQSASLLVSPWRNGLGTSRNIATQLGPDGALLWQVGIAELEQDGPFSHYPHADRIFTPIAGSPPPELAFHGGPFEACPLLVPKPFPGDVPTLSRIPSPGQAFNAIVDRRHHRAEVTVLRLAAGDTIPPPDAPIVLLHCLTGALMVDGQEAQPGDTLQGSGQAGAVTMATAGVALQVAIYGVA